MHHYGSTWRTKLKKAIYEHLTQWEISPSPQLIKKEKMDANKIIEYKAARVQTLLAEDCYCDSEIDDMVRRSCLHINLLY